MSNPPDLLRRSLLLALGLSPLGTVLAQAAYPIKPITLVVPYTAGGSSDIGARMINGELGQVLGQPVIVENVAGVGGALGVRKVARSAPDGYTLLAGSLGEALLVPLINPAAGYRVEDLLPVAYTGGTPVVFVTRPDFPANSIDEFVTLARKNPGRFSYGSPGIGTFQHVMGEAFKAKTGVFMVHIPYRGGAQIMTDVIGGQLDLGITSAVNAAGFVAGGRLKAIGVSSPQRVGAVSAAQPFGESALLKGLDFSTWGVVYAPAGTPEPIVQKLNSAINQVLLLPANVQARSRLGVELTTQMTAAELKRFVAAERAKYEPVLKTIKFE